METKAALLWESPGEWKVQKVQLDEPGFGEVLVQMAASGLCHSDDHCPAGTSPLSHSPICGGHEGSGIVRQLGPGVTTLKEGDHIITTFIPSCGKCRWCASGLQHLCDNGANIGRGYQLDGTCRMHVDGQDVPKMGMLGTFSEWQTLDELSCVKIRDDVPLNTVCLVGCGVPTGWGAAVNGGVIRPGDVVIVMGTGGVGINAVQGAHHAGAAHVIAVDPVPFKREMAMKLGATEAFDHIDAATEFARSITNGQGADSVVITVTVIHGDRINEAFKAIRKAGTVVVTSQGSFSEAGAPFNLFEISMYQKRIQGNLYGMVSPRQLMPRLIDYYADGILKLDELVTRRYTIDQINVATTDLREGRNIRGVLEYMK